MALETIKDIQQYLDLSKILKTLPKAPFFLVYDTEANVMYIDFGLHPNSADDSELTDDDVVIRYDENEKIIGLTILHASKQQ